MTAKIIKADGTTIKVEPKNGTDFSLEELNEIVNGYIEIVWFRDGSDQIMVLNEEGKFEGLPYNHQATIIAQQGKAISLTDNIVGDVLLCHKDLIK